MTDIVKKILASVPSDVFTDQDISALITGSDDRRYALVKRAIASGDIIRIKKGIYCLATTYQRKGINTFVLAGQIYGPSYISLESALSYHGLIPERVFALTSVTLKKKKQFNTPVGTFMYVSVPQEILYESVDRVDTKTGSFLIARPWKALCDYVYVHKADWESFEPVEKSLRSERSAFPVLKKSEAKVLNSNYRSTRVKRFISKLFESTTATSMSS